MKIGKIVILCGLVYIAFFNDRTADVSINDASNKQIASVGINANANAERNRKVALTAFTGFFLDNRQHLVYINTEKGLVIYNGELKAFSFRVVKQEGRFIEVDYGPRFSHDYWELTPNGLTLIDVDDNTKVFLKRLKKSANMTAIDTKTQAIALLKEGFSPSEVAKKTGENVATVRTWKSRIGTIDQPNAAEANNVELETAFQKVETLETDLKRVKRERETAFQKIETLETDLKRLKRERETAFQKIETLETDLKRLTQKSETAFQKSETVETDLKRLQGERETAFQKVETLETDLKRLQGERETAFQKVETFETDLKRLQDERETAIDAFENLEILHEALKAQFEQLNGEKEKQVYDKTSLLVFCVVLVIINILVIVPPNWVRTWDIIIGSLIVCFLAPFVEYQYSSILIEIWAKLTDKEQRTGILKHLYKEWFAVCLLLPAMAFQSRDVFKLVYSVLNVEGWEIVFPAFIAFSFQLYGLMQTLHLPKKSKI